MWQAWCLAKTVLALWELSDTGQIYTGQIYIVLGGLRTYQILWKKLPGQKKVGVFEELISDLCQWEGILAFIFWSNSAAPLNEGISVTGTSGQYSDQCSSFS